MRKPEQVIACVILTFFAIIMLLFIQITKVDAKPTMCHQAISYIQNVANAIINIRIILKNFGEMIEKRKHRPMFIKVNILQKTCQQ